LVREQSECVIFAPRRFASLEQAARDLDDTRSVQGKRLYKTLLDASPKSKSGQWLTVANRRLQHRSRLDRLRLGGLDGETEKIALYASEIAQRDCHKSAFWLGRALAANVPKDGA
jgi:hypothetical protein